MIAGDLTIGIADDLAEQISHFAPEDKVAVAMAFLAREISKLPEPQRSRSIDIISYRLPRVVAGMVSP
jgi:hypothetical protein